MNNELYLVIIGMGVTFLLALAVIFFYILYQRRLLKQQRQIQEAELAHQAALLHATIRSQEEERKRVGRDLHDEIGGMLSNLRMNINRLGSGEKEQQCNQLIDKTIASVRSIAHSLSPPALELFGLQAALEELTDDINRTGLLHVRIDNKAHIALQRLDMNALLMLYRVMQELLSNTLKHAAASNVSIVLEERDNSLAIEYADDGKGIEGAPDTTGMGMRNIESRLGMIGATYSIHSSPGQGFRVNIIHGQHTHSDSR